MQWRYLWEEKVQLLLLNLNSRQKWVVSITPQAAPPPPPGERTPDTHWGGGWVSPRANMERQARGKILCPCRELPQQKMRVLIKREHDSQLITNFLLYTQCIILIELESKMSV
jgi:hypothetical protein